VSTRFVDFFYVLCGIPENKFICRPPWRVAALSAVDDKKKSGALAVFAICSK
jgi:hypothetical protein